MHNQSIALLLPLLGGGTTRHATEMAYAWSMQNYNAILVEVYHRIINVKVYCDGRVQNRYKLLVDNDLNSLNSLLVYYHTVLVHVHHLLNFSVEFLYIHQILNIPLAVTLHDYYMLCPNIKLINENDVYCGEPSEEGCNKCLLKRPYYGNNRQQRIDDIQKWRGSWHRYLLQASFIVAPSEDVKKRFLKYFSDLKIKVIENPEVTVAEVCGAKSRALMKNGKRNIRIGLLGILSNAKGADVLYHCALDAKKRRLPIQFNLFGDFVDEGKTKKHLDNIHVLGRYKENEIYSLIQQNDIDFFWFPSVWPETYSYTLTIPIRLNIPVVGSDLGAIGQRITEHGWGITYPWNLNPSAINDLLIEFYAQKYKQCLFDFKIENNHFPNIKNYYGSSLGKESADPIDEKEIIKLKQIEKNALRHNKINKLNGYELKELFVGCDSLIARMKFMTRLDILWLVNYLKSHPVKYVIKRILK